MARYANAADLTGRFPELASIEAVELESLLDFACDWVDVYCQRRFDLEATATTRVYETCDRYVVDLGAFEIGTTADVVVSTDDGSGTYATILAASAYRLEPVNAPHRSPARPYTRVRRLHGSWPYAYTPRQIQERIQIEARYGWPAVPDAVREACLVIANEEVENPSGVRSESIDGYSVTRRSVAQSADSATVSVAKAKLAGLRRGWAA